MKLLYDQATATAAEVEPARLETLSVETVRALKQRSRQAARELVEKSLKGMDDPDGALSKALFRYVLSARRQRMKPNKKALQELAQSGAKYVDDQRVALDSRAPFQLHEVRNYRNMATSGASKAGKSFEQRLTGLIFPDEQTHRIYLPLAPSNLKPDEFVSRTHAEVAVRLHELGFEGLDYLAGTAKDQRGNTVKLNKLLRESAHAEELADRVIDDRARLGDADKLAVVISRHPYDVMRMSTGRGWQSCMAKGGMYWEKVREDMREGTMVAYLISRNDPEINDPLSRILLKPFRNDQGETVMITDNSYGLAHREFKSTVRQFAHQVINAEAGGGTYKLAGDLYADGRLPTQRELSAEARTSATAFLRELGVKYVKVGPWIWARGDIKASGIGLDQLPDLSKVSLYGRLDLQDNNLTSLKGFPRHVSGDIDLSRNRVTHLRELGGRNLRQLYISGNKLQTLQGGPRRVRQWFVCDDNPLSDLCGAPRCQMMRTPFGRFNRMQPVPEHLQRDQRPGSAVKTP